MYGIAIVEGNGPNAEAVTKAMALSARRERSTGMRFLCRCRFARCCCCCCSSCATGTGGGDKCTAATKAASEAGGRANPVHIAAVVVGFALSIFPHVWPNHCSACNGEAEKNTTSLFGENRQRCCLPPLGLAPAGCCGGTDTLPRTLPLGDSPPEHILCVLSHAATAAVRAQGGTR